MIRIIDYGLGNIGSIYNMFKKIKVDAEITSDLEKIDKAQKIILPGVGSFDKAMTLIGEMGLRNILDKKALVEKIPILGICLGMQLLTDYSEEGKLNGFGYVPAETKKFKFYDNYYKVPHMGWNLVYDSYKSLLTENLPYEPRFYFVHSYYVDVKDEKYSILKTKYGMKRFDSAIANENIFGVQFHPEKSHKFGMKILENFAKI